MKKPSLSKAKFKKAFDELLWPRRTRFVWGFVLIILSRTSGLVLPYSTKILIDEVITAGTTSLLSLLDCGWVGNQCAGCKLICPDTAAQRRSASGYCRTANPNSEARAPASCFLFRFD